MNEKRSQAPHQTPKGRGGPRTTSKAKCGAKFRSGRPGTCKLVAGYNTDHLGTGRCWLHGGNSPIKHGLYSQTVKAQNQELLHALTQAQDTDSLRQEVAVLRVKVLELAEAPTGLGTGFPTQIDKLKAMVELIDQVTRAVERKVKVEAIHAIRMSPAEMEQAIQTMKSILERHIPDPKTLQAIGRDLTVAFPYGQPGQDANGYSNLTPSRISGQC